jgi:hypothetical protein
MRDDQQEDVMRQIVRGLLTLALTTAATWLAGRLTEMILGAESD